MSKYLPVAPARILQALHDRGTPKDSFLLAHEVVKNPHGYRALAKKWQSVHTLTILDNSVIELGGAVDLDMVQEAAEICRPRVVVLPDVLEDGAGTVKATLDAWGDWEAIFGNQWHYRNEDLRGKHESELMFVPQGKDLHDWITCLEDVIQKIQPTWIGIPRNATSRIVHSRAYLVDIVKSIYPDAKIHLLGFSDYIWDDVVSARHPGVSSIDSAVPVRYHTELKLTSKIPSRGDWWSQGEYTDLTLHNYMRAQNWVR